MDFGGDAMSVRTNTFVTIREHKRMRKLRAEGLRLADIARIIGRPISTVHAHCLDTAMSEQGQSVVLSRRIRSARRTEAWFAALNAVAQGG